MELIVGIIFLIYFSMQEKASEDSSIDLAAVFSDKVKSIRSNVVYLMIIGGLIAGATNLLLMAGDPISLNLLEEGKQTDAGIAVAVRALGFILIITCSTYAIGIYRTVLITLYFVVYFLSYIV